MPAALSCCCKLHVYPCCFTNAGVANILWSLGAMKKKHGEAFALRTDVLAALTFLVKRIVPSFAVQVLLLCLLHLDATALQPLETTSVYPYISIRFSWAQSTGTSEKGP